VRKIIVSSCIGIACISWLAGCTLFDTRKPCEKCGAVASSASSHGGVRNRVAASAPKKGTMTSANVKVVKPGGVKSYEGAMTSISIGTSGDGSLPPVLPEIPITSVPPADVNPNGTRQQFQEIVPMASSSSYVPRPNETTQQAPKPNPPVHLPPSLPAGDPSKKEQTIALKSVHIKYGHGENFTTVTGQLQAYRKTYRLRYASIEQEDRYGGVVTLEGADLSKLRDGQHARIQGVLVPPTERNGPAMYRVQSIEILD